MNTDSIHSVSADRIIDLNEVKSRVSLSRSTIRRLELAGLFPRRRKIGRRKVGWLESEVLEFVKACPTVRASQGE
jgi:prophage regulatory protein